jgi:hypothetical protein
MKLKTKQHGYINLDGLSAICYMALFGLVCAAILALGGVGFRVYTIAKLFI